MTWTEQRYFVRQAWRAVIESSVARLLVFSVHRTRQLDIVLLPLPVLCPQTC